MCCVTRGREGGREGEGEGRVGEGRGGGRDRRDECYTYSNGPQYLNSSYVTYYVITCQSAFEYMYVCVPSQTQGVQWYGGSPSHRSCVASAFHAPRRCASATSW